MSLGEVQGHGGCPRFGVGTWVLGWLFLLLELAMPAGLNAITANAICTLLHSAAIVGLRCCARFARETCS